MNRSTMTAKAKEIEESFPETLRKPSLRVEIKTLQEASKNRAKIKKRNGPESFVIENSKPTKSKSKAKEWIINNTDKNVLVNRAAHTIVSGKESEPAVIIKDYAHKDVFTKEDLETPEFKSLVRKGILEFVSGNYILNLVKTNILNRKDNVEILNKIEKLSNKDFIAILNHQIVRRLESIDEESYRNIKQEITNVLRESKKLDKNKVVDETNSLEKPKESFVVDISSNDVFKNEAGELTLGWDDALNNILTRLRKKEEITEKATNEESVKDEKKNLEKFVNNSMNSLKDILVKKIISFINK